MGIDAHALHSLRYARRFGPFGRTVTIGRQSITMGYPRLSNILKLNADLSGERYCERLLVEQFQASEVSSIDYSDYEGATILHDLNAPLPENVGEFETVIEVGTVEHVFDIAQAMRNVAKLCHIGGQILHVSPADNFCGHGFWQLSPELFFSFYSDENGFQDTEIFLANRREHGFWYRVQKPRPGQRVPITSSSKVYVICRTVRARRAVSKPEAQQSDYIEAWTKPGAATAKTDHLKRLRHKYFRGVSAFNPNLERVNVSSF